MSLEPAPKPLQGNINVASNIDTDAIYDIQREVSDNGGLPLYAGHNILANYKVVKHDLCYVKRGSVSEDSPKLHVLSAINGLGSRANQQYLDDPDRESIVRDAVTQDVQYMGVAVGDVAGDEASMARGVSITMAGTNIVEYADTNVNNGTEECRPGATLYAEVCNPSDAKLGDPQRVTLKAVMRSHATPAHAMRIHVRRILENPSMWRLAMGEHYEATNEWQKAVQHVTTSYLFGGIMLIQQLIENGILVPSATLINITKDSATAAVTAVNNETNANNAAVALADLLALIPNRENYQRLDFNKQKAWKKVRIETLQRIFHGENTKHGVINNAFEFGYEHKRKKLHRARYTNNSGINESSAFGDVLSLQLNHFTQAMSGFNSAIKDQERNRIGRAISGSEGVKRVHVALGL